MFISLPFAFGNVAFGQLMGVVFFILVAIAAWSSAISLLEPMVAYLVERTKIRRGWVTFWLAIRAGWRKRRGGCRIRLAWEQMHYVAAK